MSMAVALEDLALGEVTLAQGTETVTAVLSKLEDHSICALYEALRSWTWKTLEARRRDDELSGWLDLFSRVSSLLHDRAGELATKLEAFIELLQASIMTAGAAERRDPLTRKHVKEILRSIYIGGGRIQRKHLLYLLRLKDANLSRVMATLQDDGLVVREIEGREVFYRLTMKGTELTVPLVAHDVIGRSDAAPPRLKKTVAPEFRGLFDKLVIKEFGLAKLGVAGGGNTTVDMLHIGRGLGIAQWHDTDNMRRCLEIFSLGTPDSEIPYHVSNERVA